MTLLDTYTNSTKWHIICKAMLEIKVTIVELRVFPMPIAAGGL